MLLKRLAYIAGALRTAAAAAIDLPAETTAAAARAPIVHLDYATYRGSRAAGAGVDQFLGMRFASPPVGDLRFRAPQAPAYENEVQDASKFGALCVGVGTTADDSFAEDCLFANVFKPANATAASKLPVWVFIQGGGYAANSNGNYNGSQIVQQSGGNIVFVNFNYRVGVLGFLASEEVRHDGALNAGLLDERMLLRWVQKYISQFGGDPKHVVIHGDSAGGGSVSYHLTAYGGNDKEDLFVGAMPESPFWPTQRTVQQMRFQWTRLLDKTNCASLNCLRKLGIRALREASLPSPFPEAHTGDPLPLWYWLPVIDGHLVQDHMYSQFQTGQFKRVPMLIGDDTNEGTFFAANASTETEALAFLRANYPRLKRWQLALVSNLYPKMDPLPKHAAYFPSTAAAYGDCTFTCAGNAITDAISSFVGRDKSWNYRYNVADPEQVAEGFGVPHVAEIGAIFGPDNVQGQEAKSLRTTNAAIVPVTMAYFSSFVQYLDPNVKRHPGSPVWQNWASEDEQGRRMRLETNKTVMEAVPFDLIRKCQLWRFLASSMDV
ncbi:Carboxylesterase, type B [Cordyceps fumosorosea ARSEF 2679]|uniref:Carboxylic ester hydrolase n=1 Tax=Cordyceps fumosorosea (strain ARSEF 2679) TaxID=1081104 RepID=A0A167TJX1_CORFA|nr:Carboxylesterase, type B [Cordyceps fumosorosea ARSEF 2679]OAA60676.1 Carboxylesterase, type B [Cordyceps fumosorosea ARSEF 2679]